MEKRDEVKDFLITNLASLGNYEKNEIVPDANITAYLMDSIRIAEFISRVEKKYQMEMQEEDITRLTTLNQVLDYVMERLAKKT